MGALSSDGLRLAAFLSRNGLPLLANEQSSSYEAYVFGDEFLTIHIEQDRGAWNLYVVDPTTPNTRYGLFFARWLISLDRNPTFPFFKQISFVENHWAQIKSLFSAARRNDTHSRFASFAKERAKSEFDVWPRAVLAFAKFLEDSGFPCEHRLSPQGYLGPMDLRHGNRNMSVLMSSKNRWVPQVAETVTRPDDWYAFPEIVNLLDGPAPLPIRFPHSYTYLRERWETIVRLFDERNREATHARLQQARSERLD